METKTINVSRDTWSRLARMKIDLDDDSIEAVIVRLLNRTALQDEMAKHIEVTGVRKK